jgi:FG-GAP-like repeat/FG-GAP repeat
LLSVREHEYSQSPKVQGNTIPQIGAPTDTSGSLAELANQTNNNHLDQVSGIISFTDKDKNDPHSISSVSLVSSTLSGTGSIPADTLAALNGALTALVTSDITDKTVTGKAGWSFSIEDQKLDFLAAGQTLTLVYNVQISDSFGGKVVQPITVTITGAAEPPSFTRTDMAAGAGPISVAVADFNHDGINDLVVANGNSFSTVSVSLGNADGTFQASHDFVVGESHQVITADLNGDGNLDLVNANSNSSTVSVSLGNGDGTFQDRVTFVAGDRPVSVAVADLNGDGFLDIATANYGGNTASVLLGDGLGSFQSPTTYDVGTQPGAVSIGDVNGDSILDVVIGNQVSNSVSVLLGTGGGGFQHSVDYARRRGRSCLE